MCFHLIYVILYPPILTMMHLCMMQYTYWTPLQMFKRVPLRSCSSQESRKPQ